MARKSTGRPRGRPPGSQQYPSDDRLCEKMAFGILAGKASTVSEVARQLAPRAEGPADLESKVRRLVRRYRDREQYFLERGRELLARAQEMEERINRMRAESVAGILHRFDQGDMFSRMIFEQLRQQDELRQQLEMRRHLLGRPLLS